MDPLQRELGQGDAELHHAFEEYLESLDLRPEDLVGGAGGGDLDFAWLSPAWRALLQRDPALQKIFREFLAMERSLWAGSAVSGSSLFAHRLMQNLPRDPQAKWRKQRVYVLTAAYGAAAAVAGWCFWSWCCWSALRRSLNHLLQTVVYSEVGLLWGAAGVAVLCSLLLCLRPSGVVKQSGCPNGED